MPPIKCPLCGGRLNGHKKARYICRRCGELVEVVPAAEHLGTRCMDGVVLL